MATTLNNYIGGRFVPSTSADTLDVPNPATAEVLAKVPVGTTGDVDAAVAAAKAAFKSWRETPPLDRAQYFFKMKTLLEANFEELAQLNTKENGKTLAESRGDVRRGIQNIEVAAGIPTLMMGESLEDVATGIDCVTVRRPMGVFAAITPFNFPAMVPFWFWPYAVATGNTFILKPSERVPLTQQRIFELIESVGLPKGVLNLVHGTKDVVNALCDHPDIQGVSFVGSTAIAKHVYTRASASGKRVQALGGAKNFMIVMPDADREKTIATISESAYGCCGQRCLAASVVIPVGEAHTWLREGLLRTAKQIKTGNGLGEGVTMGPAITPAAKTRILSHIDLGVKEGAELLLDGRDTSDLGAGNFVRPTLFDKVTNSMTMAKEEIFGPVLAIMPMADLDKAIETINGHSYANTTSIFTTSGKWARYFQYRIDPSMIGVNIGVPAPMSFFGFGGAHQSFFGDTKAHGKEGIAFYTDTKVSIVRWF